jgi:hypothetical protein
MSAFPPIDGQTRVRQDCPLCAEKRDEVTSWSDHHLSFINYEQVDLMVWVIFSK